MNVSLKGTQSIMTSSHSLSHPLTTILKRSDISYNLLTVCSVDNLQHLRGIYLISQPHLVTHLFEQNAAKTVIYIWVCFNNEKQQAHHIADRHLTIQA